MDRGGEAPASAIHQQIAEESPRNAAALITRLINRVHEQLEVLPKSGRHVPEYPEIALREKLIRPYRIIYDSRDNEVHVLTLVHYRQRLPKRPEDLLG